MPVTIEHRAALFFALTALPMLPHAYGQGASAATGSVCTGLFTAYTPTAENRRVYMTVGDSEKFYFNHPGTVALGNLDLHKTYVVRIFDGDKQTDAWKLRFDRLKVQMVTIWRSPGIGTWIPMRRASAEKNSPYKCFGRPWRTILELLI